MNCAELHTCALGRAGHSAWLCGTLGLDSPRDAAQRDKIAFARKDNGKENGKENGKDSDQGATAR